MTLIKPGLVDTLKNNKRTIAYLGGVLVLIVLCLFLADKCSKMSYDSKQKKANANLANAMEQLGNLEKQAENVNTDIEVQKERIAQAQREANDAAKEAAEAERLEKEANANLQNSLNNLNAVRGRDFNGTSSDDANRARCAAVPDAPECR